MVWSEAHLDEHRQKIGKYGMDFSGNASSHDRPEQLSCAAFSKATKRPGQSQPADSTERFHVRLEEHGIKPEKPLSNGGTPEESRRVHVRVGEK